MSELKYTDKKPTTPGLYWYRKDEMSDHHVVSVDDWGLSGLKMNFHDDDRWYELRSGQWAGPLEPPR